MPILVAVMTGWFEHSALRRLATAFLAIGILVAPIALHAGQLTVFAAASLKTAMDDVAEQFQDRTGHKVVLSYGGSSILARQIEQGAPADLVLTANPEWMDHLEALGRLEPGLRRDLLGNRLVLVAHDTADPISFSNALPLKAMLGQGRLAMALVDAVPAGTYGKAALEHLGLWDSVAGQVVETDNVRAALRLVAMGEADFGIVYATDAIAEPAVELVGFFPLESHAAIRYPAAVVAGRDRPEVQAFFMFLDDAAAITSFEHHGFDVLREQVQ